MGQRDRMLWLAMRALIRQPKRLAMQAWSPSTWTLFGGAIHHAASDQTYQQVSVHFGLGQSLQVVTTVERHHRTRCIGALGGAYRGDLVKRHLRRRRCRRAAALDVQR